ncbi:hypothetical protein Phi4:1_gp005 [Cellulophaga phage phi4:1]|uniref:Uncharacterized protein n=5 Tax=Lightbulbvirus TaxID=1918522 RepID=A0A0S2MWC0_9CAUD|nr:hypothetical protein Phi4:1_gp005 [Cellulophaga phage phi4:1]YP_008241500.1 hypothetical protein Phi17:2_gp005 [Cellulophaga phage phi17:2]ALO80014.1 hypothetical protein Phi4113_005 [Cellulophaga phage phi4:1_13]ALO80211.1 hypothetical protein Phi4118_005 [Cellulophaga phage phi4:1_18]ALO80408.1 hypothetical protein Phi17218_005 [Cellulophaga phage phi17:2_18]AGO47538.1 hypothetical protein Phi17:2_gp005 [Cellulophaga phage phi17:2]AGO49418.1 hypothetical protein Phi4:1_gp005 [Cellulophag
MSQQFQKEQKQHSNGSLYRCRESDISDTLVYDRFQIVKVTPKGYTIKIWSTTTRWVSSSSKKRFAYKTKEEALEGFILRKRRQIKILQAQLSKAKRFLIIAEK